jgi:hypothetical protein
MWNTIIGVVLAIIWLLTTIICLISGYDLVWSFFRDVGKSAIQQIANGIFDIGLVVSAYCFARAADKILTATRN